MNEVMKNLTVKSLKDKKIKILRFEDGMYLCPRGHEVQVVNDSFKCRTCRESFVQNK